VNAAEAQKAAERLFNLRKLYEEMGARTNERTRIRTNEERALGWRLYQFTQDQGRASVTLGDFTIVATNYKSVDVVKASRSAPHAPAKVIRLDAKRRPK
jgi:hypothetical protein